MSYSAADAMRDRGYSEDEVETALDTGTVEDYVWDSFGQYRIYSDEAYASIMKES